MFRGGQDHVKDANLKIWDQRLNGTMSEYGLANLPYTMESRNSLLVATLDNQPMFLCGFGALG